MFLRPEPWVLSHIKVDVGRRGYPTDRLHLVPPSWYRSDEVLAGAPDVQKLRRFVSTFAAREREP